jgi:exodeoxyribonuclease X
VSSVRSSILRSPSLRRPRRFTGSAEYLHHYGNPFTPDDEGLIFIAHNAQFDARMLADVLPEGFTRICTLKMARTIWPDIDQAGGNHQLGTLAVMFKLGRGDGHRALGDVTTGVNLLRHMAMVTGAETLMDLLALGTRKISQDAKLNFGQKHKDTKIKDVPISYIQWMLANVTDLDPDLRVAITSRLK